MALFDLFGIGQAPDYLSSLMDEEQRKKLQQQATSDAMINFGLNALSQGGYSKVPVGLGQIIGSAGKAGLEGYQASMDQGIQNAMLNQKLALAKQAQDREKQMRVLAQSLYNKVPAQYAETQQAGINVPVAPEAGAVAPNFNTQYQQGEVTREMISPERSYVNTDVLGRMAALSDNPIEALKMQTELVPKLRAAGMVQEAVNQPNPFEMWVTGAQSPAVKKLAESYSTSFKNGLYTDPEKINKTLTDLANMDEKHIARIENAADKKEMMNANLAMRKEALQIAQENQAAMRGIQQEGLNLRRDIANQKIDEKKSAKEAGVQGLTDLTTNLRAKYQQLNDIGAIVNPEKGTVSNIIAGAGSSGLGQIIGGKVGTQAQSIRNSINQTRPLLLQAIKNATGMSSKQMDSNAELQMYLRSATDPNIDIKANLEALDNLERLYGGASAQKASTPATPAVKAAPLAIPSIGEVRNGYEFLGGNPNDKTRWRKK